MHTLSANIQGPHLWGQMPATVPTWRGVDSKIHEATLTHRRSPDPHRQSWQFWFHCPSLSIPRSHVLPRNTPCQIGFPLRMDGVSLQPGKQGRAESADTHLKQTKRDTRWPLCPPARCTHSQLPGGQRTKPLAGPQTAGELTSDGDWALYSPLNWVSRLHWAGDIIYWTCHWFFSCFFSRGCCFCGPSQQSINSSVCPKSNQRPKGTARTSGNVW